MKLVVVSHTPHYGGAIGMLGFEPTVREIDHLATLFEEVTHVAPVHDVPAPGCAGAYAAQNVRVRPVGPAGGTGLKDKVGVLLRVPEYACAIREELRSADVVHVRCPANISLVALWLLTIIRAPGRRWFKYAGNWQPRGREPLSYRLQRFWLRHRLAGGVVTINGRPDPERRHIRFFYNPCLTEQELARGASLAEKKVLHEPWRLLFAGRLEMEKGPGEALWAAAELRRRGIETVIDLAGDGRYRSVLERQAAELNMSSGATFHRWLPRSRLEDAYAQAHFVILPSSAEGWPKVLSEAMAFGAVPIASDVSCIGDVLRSFGTGRVIQPRDRMSLLEALLSYRTSPDTWLRESQAAVAAAANFTYSRYLACVRQLLDL